jgi:hypothetical protein
LKIKEINFSRISWLILILFVVILFTNLGIYIAKGMTTRTLPFSLKDGKVTKFKDESYKELLKDKIVTFIDSFETFTNEPDENRELENSDFNISVGEDVEDFLILENIFYPQIIGGREVVEITIKDTLSETISNHLVNTRKIIDITKLFNILIYLFLLLFSLFNSYILIRYSQSKENLLIVFFLLFLFSPKANSLLNPALLDIWSQLISPFWGILFYHFIVLRTRVKKNIKKLYITSAIIFGALYSGQFIGISLNIQHIWASFWLIKGFLLLRKQYKKSKDIELKRLLGAFGGIGFSLFSILAFFALVLIILLVAGIGSIAGLTNLLDKFEMLAIITGLLALLPVIGFVLGILWFFGSFSWSLLTGTVLDVKIRSTLIYSLVGFVFIVMFGLIDYTLGEILQSVFGKFVGSDFIAGIPATIGLLLFFNPVRNYAERIVDKRLNSSDLDFLAKAEIFSRNISEEGIIEGFEEYICDNLITKLAVTKVAIISFDSELQGYKYNEIRGSDIVENSLIEDQKQLLSDNELIKISQPVRDIQDVGSFTLIFRLLYETEHKWFLALGKKKDTSLYNKKDIAALTKLMEKIILSLKFILTYENLTKEKFEKIIEGKDKLLQEQDHKIIELEKKVRSISKPIN